MRRSIRLFATIAVAAGLGFVGRPAQAGIEEHKPCPIPARHAAPQGRDGRDLSGEFALKWALAPLGIEFYTVEEAQSSTGSGDDQASQPSAVDTAAGSLVSAGAVEPTSTPAAAGCAAGRPTAPGLSALGVAALFLVARRRRKPAAR